MDILEFEKYLLEKNLKDKNFNENFLENLKKDFKEKLNLIYSDKNRRLTDEETVYDYFDDTIAELFESLEQEKENHDNCECHHCECEEETKDIENLIKERIEKNKKLVYKLGLYLLRGGIHYDDLTQDGLIGLIEASSSCEANQEFEKYKAYFIVKEMFNHINSYAEYRKLGFKQYIENEKNKPKKVKISLKNADDEKKEELKKLEQENKIKHKSEMQRLENISNTMFDYFNLKYRLSLREIEILTLYFGLDYEERKNFTDIQNIMKIDSDTLDKLLRESLFKLSVTNEKVEL